MKRFALLLLFVCLVLANCGKIPEEPSPTPEPTPTPTATPTPTPTPTPEPTPAYINGLSGEPSDTDPNIARPYAVMLNNIEVALPQCGVGEADIVYEILAEGGITRMLAIFSDISDAGNLGSMRSARPYYIEVAESYDAIYVHAGGSEQAYSDISRKGIDNIDGVRSGYGDWVFFRDKDRMKGGYEHSLFTSSELVSQITEEQGYETEHAGGSFDYGLNFTEDARPKNGADAEEIEVVFSTGKSSYFSFDPSGGDYALSEYGGEYIDGNTNEALRFKNILVLFTTHTTLDSEGRLAVSLTEGEGLFFSDGAGAGMSWSRESGIFKYKGEDGAPLELCPGKTFICIVPIGNSVNFS